VHMNKNLLITLGVFLGVLILIGIIVSIAFKAIIAKQYQEHLIPENISNADPQTMIDYCTSLETHKSDTCFLQVAMLNSDVEGYENGELCQRIISDHIQVTCVVSFVSIRNDSSLCKNINNDQYALNCLSYTDPEATFCEEYEEESLKQSCYEQMR